MTSRKCTENYTDSTYQKQLITLINYIPGIRYLAQVVPLICLNFQVPVGAGLPKMRAGVTPVFRN